jgi:hypothetical protein
MVKPIKKNRSNKILSDNSIETIQTNKLKKRIGADQEESEFNSESDENKESEENHSSEEGSASDNDLNSKIKEQLSQMSFKDIHQLQNKLGLKK